jgi:hypothetical protein
MVHFFYAHIPELIADCGINVAHFCDKGDGREQDTMVAVREEVLRLCGEMVCEFRNLLDDA